jgi:hypothetical protein
MGGALGLAILTSLAFQYTTHLIDADYRAPLLALDDGFRLAFLLAASFALIGAIAAFRLIPRVRPGAPGAGLAPAPAAADGSSAPRATVHPLPLPVNQPVSSARPAPSDETPVMPISEQPVPDARPTPPSETPAVSASPAPAPQHAAPTPPNPSPRPAATVAFCLAGGQPWPTGGSFTGGGRHI